MNFVDYVKNFFGVSTDIEAQTIIAEIKQEVFFKELALYTAISYIASSISKCEIKTFVNNKEVKEKDYYTLNVSPNINQNSSQFWHKVIETMFYKGKALVFESNGNMYCADSFSVEEFPILGNRYTNVRVDNLTLSRSFSANEVWVFRLDNVELKKLIDGLYLSYGEILAYAMKSYKKSNGIKYKLKIDRVKAGDKTFNEQYENVVKKQLKTFIENDSAVYPEFEGYNLTDISPKSNVKDASDITMLKKDIFETVAQSCKIPLAMMLGNITNIHEVVKGYITFAVDPITDMIGEELTRKPGYEYWKKGNYYKVDTSTINHIDILDVAEKVDKLIASGTVCVDEIREKIDLPALGTEFGQTHFITKNYQTAEQGLLKGGEEDGKDKIKIQI